MTQPFSVCSTDGPVHLICQPVASVGRKQADIRLFSLDQALLHLLHRSWPLAIDSGFAVGQSH